MKYRGSFVSNSSSTSFIMTNTSKEEKTLMDFVKENPDLLTDFDEEYGNCYNDGVNMSKDGIAIMIDNAESRNDKNFKPGETKYISFGDEEGTLLGRVYDYMLRDGGSSKSFIWSFHEWQR